MLPSPDSIAQIEKLSMAPMELGRVALTRRIADDAAFYRQLMARAGVVPQQERNSTVWSAKDKLAFASLGSRIDIGADYLTRTDDLPLTRRLLYQLS